MVPLSNSYLPQIKIFVAFGKVFSRGSFSSELISHTSSAPVPLLCHVLCDALDEFGYKHKQMDELVSNARSSSIGNRVEKTPQFGTLELPKGGDSVD